MLKNVVIVNDSNYISGGEDKVAIQTANMLAKEYQNLNIYFFSSNGKENNHQLDEKIVDICTNQGTALDNPNKLKGSIMGIYNRKAKKQLKCLLQTLDNKNTVVHIHSWTKSLTASVFDAIDELGFKCVLTMHDYFTACPNGGYFNYKLNEICMLKPLSFNCVRCNCDSRNYLFKIYRIIRQFFFKKSLSKLKNVISISDFSENVLKKTLNSNINITRIYNPIDFDINIKKINPEKNDYYLYVGRVSKEKGVDVFCEALNSIKRKGIVVGDGDQKNFLENKYPSIDFVGWKNSFEVRNYMKNARCLIIPSRWYECSPLTPIEGMMIGLPCISSNCNASIDYLKYDNGLIFETLDDLKKKILQCENDELLKKLSINSYNYANENWGKNDYLLNIYNYYNNLLNDK